MSGDNIDWIVCWICCVILILFCNRKKRGILNIFNINFIIVLWNVFYMCYIIKEYLFNFKEMSVKIYRIINFVKRIKKNY